MLSGERDDGRTMSLKGGVGGSPSRVSHRHIDTEHGDGSQAHPIGSVAEAVRRAALLPPSSRPVAIVLGGGVHVDPQPEADDRRRRSGIEADLLRQGHLSAAPRPARASFF